MKILFLCGREVQYPLNQFLLHCFREFSEVDVIDETGSGKSILKRSLQVFLKAGSRLRSRKYDLVFVGFFGHFLMPPTRLLTRAPILFHPFISTFETLIYDRKKAAPNSLMAKTSFLLDHTAFHAADHLLLDTKANVSCFSKMFNVPEEKFSVVYMGSDERMFYPRPGFEDESLTVLYHGSYLPLQGIDVIIQAAKLLDRDTNIHFRLVGKGLEYARTRKMVDDLGIKNIEFHPAVPLKELPEQIARASICLGGHFGTSDKAARVIAGKTFQDLAMGKATVVGDNSANRELLSHGQDAWFCPMDDPNALADGIRGLAKDRGLREKIGENAHQTFLKCASMQVLTPQVQQVVERAITAKN